MAKLPKVVMDSRMVDDTVSLFRYHRPVVFGEELVDSPVGFADPYCAYDFGAAAYDYLLESGVNLSQPGYFILQSALAEAAEKQVPNAEAILLRRQKAAEMLNQALRLKHRTIDQQG